MEIEGTDGSKTLLKPGSSREFGRGLGFTSDDRTVSRRQISFQIHNPPDHEDETKVSFEVVGRNPIWVYSNQDGEVRTFRKFERGEMENGDMFCVSASKPIWFTLKRIDLDDEDKRGAEKELEMETQLAETLQSSSCPVGIGLDVENIDISGIDPVQENSLLEALLVRQPKESFRKYFSQYGEVTNSVLIMHKSYGWPRGFGFVTYADPKIADKVLEEEHIIGGRKVEVKKTIPKKDMHVKGASNTKKFFVGGLPLSLTKDELKEYFSSYGNVVEHQIVLNHTTGRPRGFGFVRFDKEEAVEKVLSNGHMHELRGKQVEIKRVEPKRAGAEHTSESRLRCCRCGSKSYDGNGGFVVVFGGGYGENMGSTYGGYADYGLYSVSPICFYPGYSNEFWFGGAMYGAFGYGGSNNDVPAYYGGDSRW